MPQNSKLKNEFQINLKGNIIVKEINDDIIFLLEKKLKIKRKDILGYEIHKKSLDCRKKPRVFFNYVIYFSVSQSLKDKVRNHKEVQERNILRETWNIYEPFANKECEDEFKIQLKGGPRPILIGFGPSNMFLGLKLSKIGLRPIILERGADVKTRLKDIILLKREGIFNESSNVAFGEGGAGTYSDGKLTSRSKSPCQIEVLRTLVEYGAPEEILYINNPHLGTDVVATIVKNMRLEIEKNGGSVLFSKCVRGIKKENFMYKVETTDNCVYESNTVVFGTGHSARDTSRCLLDFGVPFKAKPFSVGFRIEHKREFIDENQYGNKELSNILGASEYHLRYKDSETNKSVYSFCMCPGGEVVPSNSNKWEVVTNGMSYSLRNLENSNSAIVATVNSNDFGDNPYDALNYQEQIEKKAYEKGGKNYFAIGQNAKDFINNEKCSKMISDVKGTYKPGITLGNLQDLFSKEVNIALVNGLLDFDKKIKDFINKGFLTGPETRTSSPIQVIRNENMAIDGFENLYLIGEGSGFSGGIVSSSIEGIKCYNEIIRKYRGELENE